MPKDDFKAIRISIHALREEGDPASSSSCTASSRFLSTPSARRATQDFLVGMGDTLFLSTPSARRATGAVYGGLATTRGFLSTPSARRATVAPDRLEAVLHISIHALREEGDVLRLEPISR